ncbi:MAG: ATP-binding cassette domain-containing protein [Pseudomonadota bacterium]
MEGVQFTWPDTRFSIAVECLEIEAGSRVLLQGPSGSGKSTLLSLIAGIVAPAQGTIRLAGAPFSTLSAPRRDRLRAEHFGIIFQMFNLLPYASPIDNVILPLAFAPARAARVGRDRRDEAARLMRGLRLGDDVIGAQRASGLSVGQQQRVAVARALIGGPQIVIADEPTSALDASAREAFLAILFEQVAAAGATLVMVSHDTGLGTGLSTGLSTGLTTGPRTGFGASFDRRIALDDIATASREGA